MGVMAQKLIVMLNRPKSSLKMIISIILISLGCFFTNACEEDQEEAPPAESVSDQDRQIEEAEEGRPHAPKQAPPLTDPSTIKDSGPEVLSSFPPEIDKDQDGVVDEALPNRPDLPVDNCPQFYNPDQEDEDNDGVGDACQ